MTATSQVVSEEYSTWKELVYALKDVEHAPPAVAELTRELDHVVKTLATVEKNTRVLETKTKKEKDEWEAIRDRAHKRLWVKIKHPSRGEQILNEMEQKEEKEYVDALALEQSAIARANALRAEKRQVDEQLALLRPLVEKHKAFRVELDSLYDRVFKGPNPEFPQEDSAEQAVTLAEQQDYNAQMFLTGQQRARDLMQQSLRALKQGAQHMDSARSYSTWDMFGGGTMSDMLERNEISSAQSFMHQSTMLSQQASFLSPQLGAVPKIQLPQANIWSDVIFDNIFSDMAFHDKIKGSIEQIQRVIRQMKSTVLPLADQLVNEATAAKNSTSDQLLQARQTLETMRAGIMETRGDPAPAYEPK